MKYSIVLRSNILAHVNDYTTLYYSIFSVAIAAVTRITHTEEGEQNNNNNNNEQRIRNKANSQELSSKISNAHITMMLTTRNTAGTLIKILTTFSRSTRNFSRRKYVQNPFLPKYKRHRYTHTHTHTPHSLYLGSWQPKSYGNICMCSMLIVKRALIAFYNFRFLFLLLSTRRNNHFSV